MDHSRVKQLIDAYGSAPERWPSDERVAAMALLESSRELQHFRARARRLDNVLDAHSVTTSLSIEQVMARLPIKNDTPGLSTGLDRVLEWCFPSQLPQIWRPAIAACIPLLAGVYIGSASALFVDGDEWSESERYLFASLTIAPEVEQ